jgi:hypothetical protein
LGKWNSLTSIIKFLFQDP